MTPRLFQHPRRISIVSSKPRFSVKSQDFRSQAPINIQRPHQRNHTLARTCWDGQNGGGPMSEYGHRVSDAVLVLEQKRRFSTNLEDTRSWNDVNTNAFDTEARMPLQPWKTLLETPARASWRATDPRRDPPEYLKNAMYRILDDGERTTKQLKRAHRKVLSIQSELAEHREKERRAIVNGKRRFKDHQKQQLAQQSPLHSDDDDIDSHLETTGYSRSRSSSPLPTQPVYYGYDETLGTLKHRMEPNFAITKRVLSECQSLLGGKLLKAPTNNTDGDSDTTEWYYVKRWRPKRVLDFGIGCGSASAAAIDLFGRRDEDSNDGYMGIEWIHGIDPSQPMRECSKKLIEEMTRGYSVDQDSNALNPPPTPRITFSNSLSQSSDDSAVEGSFDLALFVYTASELVDISSCLAAAAMAFEKLKPDGVFVMIEPGTPDGFNSIRAVRNMLLDCCPPHDPEFEWEDRCHIIAPCTHNGTCPMERHKKNFLGNKKPVGKLGHDLPQEWHSEIGEDLEQADENEEYESDDDEDFDHAEVTEQSDAHGMSESSAFHSSFCSFVHSISSDPRKKGEKFSYLVAQKQRYRRPVLDSNGKVVDSSTDGDPFQDDHLTNLLTDAMDAATFEADSLASSTFERAQELTLRYVNSEDDDLGLELLQGEEKRESMGRIVRAPIKKKGHVYIDYCAAPGRIIRSRVTKATSNNVAPGIYGAARKSRWGGLWPNTMGRLTHPTDTNKK